MVLFGCFDARSQSQQPVFGTKADSLLYERLNRAMIEVTKGAPDPKKLDSIYALFNDHLKKVVRYRYVYRTSTDHRPYGGIHGYHLDSIYKVSVVNQRGKLPDSLFLLTHLRSLELVNCSINKLPRKLAKLRELKTVTIYNNHPSRRFRLAKNSTIDRLTIAGDEFNRLPRRYDKVKALAVLTLTRNQMTRFPNLKGCNNLKRLILPYNKLTLEDLTTRQPAGIEEINLGNNEIVRVPDAIKAFTNLQRLNFPNNKISVVEKGIEALTKLEQVSFYKNSLTEIPSSIFTLTNLRVIDLYHNNISTIDSRIGRLANLEILYLANNQIYSLPDNMSDLNTLTELYLHHNRLSSTPPALGKLLNLQVLRINHNAILEFDKSISSLKKLRNLDISANEMKSIPLETMDFPELQLISLHSNPWNEQTRQLLEPWAETMRKRNVVVHLSAQKLYEPQESEQ